VEAVFLLARVPGPASSADRERERIRSSAMRSLLLYLLLVGIPAAGVAGILRAGAGLEAPASVGGQWTLDVAPSAADPRCEPAPGTLTISQSGVHLDAALRPGGEARLRGEMRGDTIILASMVPSDDSSNEGGDCDPAAGVRLEAVADGADRPAALRGTLRFVGCAACAPLAFTATRQAPAPAKRGHP
jgi:hypothetical protein